MAPSRDLAFSGDVEEVTEINSQKDDAYEETQLEEDQTIILLTKSKDWAQTHLYEEANSYRNYG